MKFMNEKDYKRCYYLVNKERLLDYQKTYYKYKKNYNENFDEKMKIFLKHYKKREEKKEEDKVEKKKNLISIKKNVKISFE
jgi:hypothetical protein